MRRPQFSALAMSGALVPSSCESSHSALNSAGPQAGEIENVWWLYFAVCTAVYMLSMAVIMAALAIRHVRRTRQATPPVVPTPGGERDRGWIVGAAVAM